METFPLVKRVRPENSSRIWEIRNTLQSRQASKNQDEECLINFENQDKSPLYCQNKYMNKFIGIKKFIVV